MAKVYAPNKAYNGITATVRWEITLEKEVEY